MLPWEALGNTRTWVQIPTLPPADPTPVTSLCLSLLICTVGWQQGPQSWGLGGLHELILLTVHTAPQSSIREVRVRDASSGQTLLEVLGWGGKEQGASTVTGDGRSPA